MSLTNLSATANFSSLTHTRSEKPGRSEAQRHTLQLFANEGSPSLSLSAQGARCGDNTRLSFSSDAEGSQLSVQRDRATRNEFMAAFKANFDF